MTQREFFDRLQQGLQHLPPGELAGIIAFYREAIADRMEEGFSEEEAVRDLGDVESILANYPKNDKQTTPVKNWRSSSGFRLGGCLMLIIAGPIVLGVLIMIGCILFSVAVTVSMAILLMLPLILVSAVGALLGWVFHRRGKLKFTKDTGVLLHQTFDPTVSAIEVEDRNVHIALSAATDEEIRIQYREFVNKKYCFREGNRTLRITSQGKRKIDDLDKLEIMMPANFNGDLVIHGDNGKITANALPRLGNITMMLANGKIDFCNLRVSGLAVKLDNGKITLQNIRCTGDVDINGANGKADLFKVAADGNLAVSFENAKIKVDDISAGRSIRLGTNLGLISGTLSGDGACYNAPAVIGGAGVWGTPPQTLHIELNLGKVNLEFTE